MATDSKGRNQENAAAAYRPRLSRGADELAALEGRITAGINAIRRALGQTPDWTPEPRPVPVPVPSGSVRGIPYRRNGRLVASEMGGESLADIDRRLNERLNALRAYLGKSPDWQPSSAPDQEAAEAAPARQRAAT